MNELSQPVKPQLPPPSPENHPSPAASLAPATPAAPAHGPERAAQPAERRLDRRRRRRRHRRRPESGAAPGTPGGPLVAARLAPDAAHRSARAALPVWSGSPIASEPLPPIPHALPAATRPRGEPAFTADPSLRADVSEDGKIRYRMVTRQRLGWKYLLSEVFD